MRVKSEGSETFDKVVYEIPFSSLFQEWQTTEEATKIVKSFENVVLVPMPSIQAEITLTLFSFQGGIACEHTMQVDPEDILIRPVGKRPSEHEWIWKGGKNLDSELDAEDRIDVAIVAEGYTEAEMDIFMTDARRTMESLWAHEPFASMKDRFNIVAVKCPSRDSGVSVPRENDWKDTPAASSFDTFYSDRYLTTQRLFKVHDLLAGIPYEHIIILANTDTYGGGGIFNSYTLTTAHHPGFKPVVVHEFGHSFAGLADEYFYDDSYNPYYFPGIEPWEANITTKTDFDSKWKGLVGKEFKLGGSKDFTWDGKTAEKKDKVGLHEGGGYLSRGVWRACDNCRMRTNTYPAFCPVCQRAIRSIIDFYTREQQ
jgi:IgA Peptidase M64.